MRLWRVTRARFAALDGAGGARFGTRYSSPGHPVISFASDAALAVLIALRYRLNDPAAAGDDDYVLGWTDVAAKSERLAVSLTEPMQKDQVDAWLAQSRSLLLRLPSRVLPEGDVILMNPRHPDMAAVAPLTMRVFRFADCLHVPPMAAAYGTAAPR